MDTPEPVLPKWPFYIGDGLLVTIALLIALRGDGPLTPLQMFWVVGAVALGACLFVLPFIVEYRTRVTLLQSERKQNIWENIHLLELAVQQINKTATVAKQEREVIERQLALLEGLSQRLDQKVAKIEEQDALPDGGRAQLSDDEWALLRSGQEQLLAEMRRLLQRVESEAQAGKVAQEAMPRREDGFIPGSQASGSQDGDFYSEDLDASTDDTLAEEEEEETVEESAVEPASEERGGATVVTAADAVEHAQPSAVEPEDPIESEDPIEADIDLETVATADGESAALAQSELIAVEDAATAARTQSTKGKTVLIVNALIGIGNKPYVRGVGPGLSTETGVPMEFMEIGKWRWVAPTAKEDIRCQVYRNDETAAEEGEVLIPAGQEVTLSVRFPR